jgi:hypothetical protein
MARNHRSRKTRRSKRRTHGGSAPVNASADQLGLATSQGLAQGVQFAELNKAYHGGKRRSSRSASRRHKRTVRRVRGGMADLSVFGSEGADVNRASAHLLGQDMALQDAARFSASPAGQDNPFVGSMTSSSEVEGQKGGRRRKSKGRKASRKASRKTSRKASRKGRKASRKTSRKAHRKGRKAHRGGALLEGSPYSQNGSNMLLADDSGLAAQAKQFENPNWSNVASGKFA